MGSTPHTSSAGRFRLRDMIPFGPGRHPGPRPFLEWRGRAGKTRDQLGYAGGTLNPGVGDGCSLAPRGLRDDAISGVHLCMTRLKLLRLNTMGPIPDASLESVSAL